MSDPSPDPPAPVSGPREPAPPGAATEPLVRGTLRAADGIELAVYEWSPTGEPRASVLIAHGYAEHAGRYDAFARTLAGAGYAVRALDLRGHGVSGGPKAQVASFDLYVEDLAALLNRTLAELPDLPVVLFGHSMGGVVATLLAARRQRSLAALVLSAPYLRGTSPPPGWLLPVASWLGRALPDAPTVQLDADAISRDPEAVRAYREDPLVYTGRVKAGLASQLTAAGPRALASAPLLRLPLLVVHGSDDALASPEASRELAGASGSSDTTLRIYDGGFHELLNDLERDRVTEDVLAWLDARVGREEARSGR